ncbi:MAG: M18 family aminopeptidase [Epsilonproteobacteria bacterium]|nr:M18 family aminopeptidase [Campylobacterota bacterium]
MTKQDFNEGLLGFLDASPTPFHATQNMSMMLENAGFIRLDERERWSLQKGQKYYVTRNDSSLIAFTYSHAKSYLMVGAHTDSPNLKLKPNPILKEHGIIKFAVEPYGGLLFNPWFDRELSLAGRVSYQRADGTIANALIDVSRPLAIIPSLAIHLDREANTERKINAQTDISPIMACESEFDFESFVKEQLLLAGYDDVESILAHELSFYDVHNASFVGLHNDFIAGARLDNLLSCYVGLLSICSLEADMPMLFVASDHEEVGSDSTSGAGGNFLESVLKRAFSDYEDFMHVMRSSLLISADNAHAIHPNYPSKHEPSHAPKINKGCVIKVNSNQRYASNSTSIARFMSVAKGLGEPLQHFVTRSDMGCGSTIGPITATKLGIDTIDVGLPTFAMHSIRELAGSDDAYSLFKIILGFYE